MDLAGKSGGAGGFSVILVAMIIEGDGLFSFDVGGFRKMKVVFLLFLVYLNSVIILKK